jgi:SAM-dependent methyltransferase
VGPPLDQGTLGESTGNASGSSLEILRCQETLEPLEQEGDALVSRGAGLVYPVRDGIVFMGYPEREHEFVQTVIEAERSLQSAPAAVEPGLAYLRESSVAAVALIRLIRKRLGEIHGLRGVELGAGSSWASWLFAEAGYEMWSCELEPDSVLIGQIYEHQRLGRGRRIVCDATYVPFADRSFDLVLCKEFVHHVSDKRRLFHEANRVLRPGGLLVVQEPVRSVTSTIHDRRVPDPVPEHYVAWMGQYLRAIRRSGFAVREHGALSVRRARRVPFTEHVALKAGQAVQGGVLARDPIVRTYLNLVGGELGVVAEKVREVGRVSRPRIRVIDPSAATVSPADRAAFRPFKEVLEERARELRDR